MRVQKGQNIHFFKFVGVLVIFIIYFPFCPATLYGNEVTIIDSQHYSKVLGEIRKYRILLPPDYYESTQKEYPVVYFYHGWSERYFGSLIRNKEDKFKLGIDDKLAEMVKKYSVIIVKPDGYNDDSGESYNLRPYNIGPVETYRQFPLYFPELVNYIDSEYRTIADRKHRAISGFSMGGFMSYWIAGKYPHLLAAAGSFCGSPEFVVGPKDFPVEYYHGYMYNNYKGLRVRLHYGKDDFIRAYHRDIDRIWSQVINNYERKIYDVAHDIAGLKEMFQFFVDTFQSPLDKPTRWDHIDVYPEFTVWDYNVSTNRDIPGFTVMENVDKKGFRISVRRFLPEGETLPSVKLSVVTAPLYKKNTEYIINVTHFFTRQESQKIVRSDNRGKLKLKLNGGLQEVGINERGDGPNISIASVDINSTDWAQAGSNISFSVSLINKGIGPAKGVRAQLSSYSPEVNVLSSVSKWDCIEVNDKSTAGTPFVFNVSSKSAEIVKFRLAISDQSGNRWQEPVIINIKPDNGQIKNFEIADGRRLTFIKGGQDTVNTVLGTGNGDGIANPGESIGILVRDDGQLWPTSLYTLDPSIDLQSDHTRISDRWSNFDHVGGSFKYSLPLISSDYEGGSIRMFAEYWLPDYPLHHIKRGPITIKVSGNDQTPPQMSWIKMAGDNVLRIKFYDGGNISQAEATVQHSEQPNSVVQVKLNDQGREGDSIAGDQIFSKKVTVPRFGLYQVDITTSDFSGNKRSFQIPEPVVLYGAELYFK